ncbi:MAG: FAD-dependent monooxygenase [Mesorhizobium sp.]|nr:FAD-dependent monooxygenase [Mesorhizobium sp.]
MSNPTRSRQIVIAGGGIAGLTAALAFAQRGFPVQLFERAANPQEAGAGLQLSPNATRILQRLGVLDLLRPVAVAPEAVVLRNASTLGEVARVPLGEAAAARWGAPYLVLHRADLYGALAARVAQDPAITMTTGAALRDAAFHPMGLTASIDVDSRVREVSGLLLVAADGVWSSLRRLVDGAPESRFSGRVAWRTTLRADDPAIAPLGAALGRDVVTTFLHPRAHLVAYPVRAGAAINLVAITGGVSPGEGWSTRLDPAPLHAAFGDAAAPLARLVRDAGTWTSWPLHAIDPGAPWSDKAGVVLVGDAAHAMTPFAAQGAAAAIEDAYVLAAVLDDAPNDLAGALARYEKIRRPRVRRVVRRAAFNAFAWHASGPVAAVRNAILARRSGERLAADLDWLYGWDADAALRATP